MGKKIFSGVILFALAWAAAWAEVVGKVTLDRENALYRAGEKAVFTITAEEDGKAKTGVPLTLMIFNGSEQKIEKIVTGEQPKVLELTRDKPGFIMVQARPGDVKNYRSMGIAGAGFEVEKIRQGFPKPADFDQFWARVKAEVKAKMGKPVLKEVKTQNGAVEYDLTLPLGEGEAPLSAYYSKPVNAAPKSCPAWISYHGAGVRSANKTGWRSARFKCISMDVNAHGIPNGKDAEFYRKLSTGELSNYWNRGFDSVDKCYFRGMIERLIASLEFIKSQPEWDGRILVVSGGSQGGGQALMAGGVDEDVTMVAALVPAMCDHGAYLNGRLAGWPQAHRSRISNFKPEVAAYFDSANFASSIKKAKVFVGVGYIDVTCSPDSVYAAYNVIASPDKSLLIETRSGHALSRDAYNKQNQQIYEHLAGGTAKPARAK